MQIETDLNQNIDILKASFDIESISFDHIEMNILYPFIKVLLKYFLSYSGLVKLYQISNECGLFGISSKINSVLNSVEKKDNKFKKNEKKVFDVENEFKKFFGRDKSENTQSTSISKIQKNTLKVLHDKKNEENDINKLQKIQPLLTHDSSKIIPSNTNLKKSPQERSKIFIQTYILKNKKVSESIFNKNLKNNTEQGSFYNNKNNSVPDFFKLNRELKQDGILEDKFHIIQKNAAMREQIEELQTKKVRYSRSKVNSYQKRGIRKSYIYKKSCPLKKNSHEKFDDNIINIQNSMTLLKDLDFNSGEKSQMKSLVVDSNKVKSLFSDMEIHKPENEHSPISSNNSNQIRLEKDQEDINSINELEVKEWEQGDFGKFTPTKNITMTPDQKINLNNLK